MNLYVGIMTPGTTSRMRADTLPLVVPDSGWEFVDTDPPLLRAGRVRKSVAFRWKWGPVVAEINAAVQMAARDRRFDVVWVDKGVYLWPDTVRLLRRTAGTLVYYTPDTAFFANRSRHFNASADLYDLVVTTKSFEWSLYLDRLPESRLHLTTQAYDDSLHRLPDPPPPKRSDCVFIGLCEPDREACLSGLVTAGVDVTVGGRGWRPFVKRHAAAANLTFLGDAVFGEAYVHAYQTARVGLGLLSKRFPELHTTRTFEIPACGTLLATERNAETSRFFRDDEALFFEDHRQLADEVKRLLDEPDELRTRTGGGTRAVQEGPYRYFDVVEGALRAATFERLDTGGGVNHEIHEIHEKEGTRWLGLVLGVCISCGSCISWLMLGTEDFLNHEIHEKRARWWFLGFGFFISCGSCVSWLMLSRGGFVVCLL